MIEYLKFYYILLNLPFLTTKKILIFNDTSDSHLLMYMINVCLSYMRRCHDMLAHSLPSKEFEEQASSFLQFSYS